MNTNQTAAVAVVEIPIDQILPSPLNPRTVFDENWINELSDSIRQKGVLQPITVRRVGDKYELVIGESRWRGSHKAGKGTIPSLIKDFTDAEALEVMLIENLKRRDLSLIEEAQGYASALGLRDAKGKPSFTVAILAEKIGKSEAHIGQMLSLLALPGEALGALQGKVISFSVARLIARVPGNVMKERCTQMVLHPETSPDPLNARETESLIGQNFMRTLAGAPFNPDDAKLVPVVLDDAGKRCMGGACEDCPFRTGNSKDIELQRSLSGNARGGSARGTPSNICTHVECFAAKSEASWQEARSVALKAGKRVLEDKEAEKLFPYGNAELTTYTPYVDLAVQVPRELLTDPDIKRIPSWKQVLKSVENPPEIVVVRDPRGQVRELVDRRQAEASVKLDVKKTGKAAVIKTGKDARSGPSLAEKQEKDRKKLQIAVAHHAMTELANGIQRDGMKKGFWMLLMMLAWDHAGADGFWMIAKRTGIDPEKVSGSGRDYEDAILAKWSDIKDEKELAARVVELLSAQWLKWNGIKIERFAPFLELYGLEPKKLEAEVKASLAAAKKEKAAKIADRRLPISDSRKGDSETKPMTKAEFAEVMSKKKGGAK